MAFDINYWNKNYAEPNTMDGVANAHLHVRYLQSLLALEGIKIESLVDLGFGPGVIFEKMIQAFVPYRAMGIEPSLYIFEQVAAQSFFKMNDSKIKLFLQDLFQWCQIKNNPGLCFDLGICTSVFQYISDKELQRIIPILGQRVKFLYLTVPTDEDLDRQIQNFQFKDEYALRRSSRFYRELLSPHFTFISCRLLESKTYFQEENTFFSESLFRF